MKLWEQQYTFTNNLAKLITFIREQGFYPRLREVLRTKEQAEIYAQKGIGIKDSQHCDGLAADIAINSPEGKYLDKSEEYEIFGKYWESLHPLNGWGGRFKRKDGNHFEMRDQ